MLSECNKQQRTTQAEQGLKRTKILWMNYEITGGQLELII